MPNAPSGPRNGGRAPQGPVPSSPVGPRPPTGPGGPRNAGNPLRAINNVLTGNAPADRSSERNAPHSNPPVRGRGATRANGPMDGSDMTSPMPPPSLDSTPNQHPRSSRNDDVPSRMEGAPQEEGRSESRSHRHRSGRERSPDRSGRHPEERSSRTAPSERAEGERGSDRGREKHGSNRESSRRERGERDGEPRSGREPRESSRRERGSRDDGRSSGAREEGRSDRRSRGGGGGSSQGDEARKRGRDPQDQAHGDTKRRR